MSEAPDDLPATAAEAIAYIEAFATRPGDVVDALPPRERQAARFPEMLDVLAELGNPHHGLPVAHIAGTSGKGSTATILAAIVQASGRHVGLYINPYLTMPQERIQINGSPIGDADLVRATREVTAALGRLQDRFPQRVPHLKQVWVAVMLVAFARANVDVAVIETGMGGRFDETNVVAAAISVITTVDFDHMDFLGETLAQIAWHKAGIIKPGIPAVSGVTTPDALGVIRAEAATKSAPLAVLGETFQIAVRAMDQQGLRFDYTDDGHHLADCQVPLIGAHQAANAALAIRAAVTLVPAINAEAIHAGLAAVALPGRFEIVARDPMVVLDVAHNPEKMRALVAALTSVARWQRLVVVFGALEGKAVAGMLTILAPLHPLIIATAPTVAGRVSTAPATVSATAERLGLEVIVQPDPQEAVSTALALANTADVVLVTGSLFLVSQVRARWRA